MYLHFNSTIVRLIEKTSHEKNFLFMYFNSTIVRLIASECSVIDVPGQNISIQPLYD